MAELTACRTHEAVICGNRMQISPFYVRELTFTEAATVTHLGGPSTRRWLYQTVLREASRPSDLTDYLNRGILISLWPELRLPAGVRRAWEEHHAVLHSAGGA